MAWYVTKDGAEVRGPYDEPTIVQAIRGGETGFRICEAGSKEWRDVASHPAFAAAFPPGMRQAPRDRDSAVSTGLIAGVMVVVAVAASVLGVVYMRHANEAWVDPQEARRRELCPDLKTWAECAEALDRKVAEDRFHAEAAAAAAASAGVAARAQRIEGYKKWTPAERLNSAQRSGLDMSKSFDVMDDLRQGAASDREARAIEGAFRAGRAAATLRQAHDGAEIDPGVPFAANTLFNVPIPSLKDLGKSTMGEARKDPTMCRGRWMSVSGQIVQIRRAGVLFEGVLMTDGLKPVYFVTAGKTAGLVEDSPATFVGLFAQQYAYLNVAGGETNAVVLVGHFTGQGLDVAE